MYHSVPTEPFEEDLQDLSPEDRKRVDSAVRKVGIKPEMGELLEEGVGADKTLHVFCVGTNSREECTLTLKYLCDRRNKVIYLVGVKNTSVAFRRSITSIANRIGRAPEDFYKEEEDEQDSD